MILFPDACTTQLAWTVQWLTGLICNTWEPLAVLAGIVFVDSQKAENQHNIRKAEALAFKASCNVMLIVKASLCL